MKKTIMYTITAAAIATVTAIAIVGCSGDFGSGNADSDTFLDKFHTNKRLKKFTVTYDGNGNDSGAVPTDTPHDSGTYVTVKVKGTLAKIGHKFTKWATQSDGSGATYREGDGFRISKNVTLYAQWTLETIPLFKVEVSSSIGGTGASGSGEYEQGILVTIDAGTAPDGCMFLNWTVTSGNVTVADDREPTTTFVMPDSKVTVMAVFGVIGGETGWLNDERDGKLYRTVRIGEQTWMAQNLNFESVSGSGCFYENVDDCNTYGRMYNWDAAMTVCPIGWHLPTREEWGDLAINVGGSGEYGVGGTAGTRLKAKAPDWDGTDDYGFSALPGGEYYTGVVIKPNVKPGGGIGSWWIAKGGGASHRNLMGSSDALNEFSDGANYWLSVRCVLGSVNDNGNGETPTPVYGDTLFYEGQAYTTVIIGGKTWMAKNLNIETGNSWCYEDNISNCNTYGRLYDWETAKNVCSNIGGWHLPSRQEWIDLIEEVGGQKGERDQRVVWFYASQKLKATSGWENNAGTDNYHFTALPAGHRGLDGEFGNIGKYTNWWTSTDSSNYAYDFAMGMYYHDVDEYNNDKNYGLSGRCIKND